jgi:hypothetical protein
MPVDEDDLLIGTSPAVCSYLKERFSERLAKIEASKTAPGFGSGYRRIMQEKHVISMCATLGIDLTQRHFVAASVGELSITYDDVLFTSDLKKKTLDASRTLVSKARDARRRLARYFGGHMDGAEFDEQTRARLSRHLEILKVLLTESDIDASHVRDTNGSAEHCAITIAFSTVTADVKWVLEKFSE